MRSYFDNAHDIMTDVWKFGRIGGNNRYGHATPKPVGLSERVIKSSSVPADVVWVPFLGTAPDLLAAENLGRQCRAAELQAKFIAVGLQRYLDAFGIEGRRIA